MEEARSGPRPQVTVKIITKKLAEKPPKGKGVVKDVNGKYTAAVKVIDPGDRLKRHRDSCTRKKNLPFQWRPQRKRSYFRIHQ